MCFLNQDTDGLKVGVANLITQWVKGPSDGGSQSPCRPAVSHKHNLNMFINAAFHFLLLCSLQLSSAGSAAVYTNTKTIYEYLGNNILFTCF